MHRYLGLIRTFLDCKVHFRCCSECRPLDTHPVPSTDKWQLTTSGRLSLEYDSRSGNGEIYSLAKSFSANTGRPLGIAITLPSINFTLVVALALLEWEDLRVARWFFIPGRLPSSVSSPLNLWSTQSVTVQDCHKLLTGRHTQQATTDVPCSLNDLRIVRQSQAKMEFGLGALRLQLVYSNVGIIDSVFLI